MFRFFLTVSAIIFLTTKRAITFSDGIFVKISYSSVSATSCLKRPSWLSDCDVRAAGLRHAVSCGAASLWLMAQECSIPSGEFKPEPLHRLYVSGCSTVRCMLVLAPRGHVWLVYMLMHVRCAWVRGILSRLFKAVLSDSNQLLILVSDQEAPGNENT